MLLIQFSMPAIKLLRIVSLKGHYIRHQMNFKCVYKNEVSQQFLVYLLAFIMGALLRHWELARNTPSYFMLKAVT